MNLNNKDKQIGRRLGIWIWFLSILFIPQITLFAQGPDTLWTKTYGGTYDDQGHSVKQTNDGGYIIAGMTFRPGSEYDVYLIKTDASGNTQWQKIYGGTGRDNGWSVQQTIDGGYIIAGYTSLFVNTLWINYVWLIKTNSMGDSLWTKTYGGTNDDWGRSVQQTADGGYIITGVTKSFGADDVYLIRLGTETGIEEKSSSQLSTLNSQLHLKASPNPFSKTTVIELNPRLSGSPTPQLKIYDLSGRLIRTFPSFRLAPRSSVVWDGKDGQGKEVKNGVYFARLEYNGCVAIRQMILFEVKK